MRSPEVWKHSMDGTFEHLVPLPDEGGRCLVHLPALAGTGGEQVAVFESSAATDPRVWLNIEDVGAAVSTSVEMTAGMAWRLAEQLQKLVRDHYQGDARPSWARARDDDHPLGPAPASAPEGLPDE